MSTLAVPGYRVVHRERPPAEGGLRNDVAAFIGPTVRGPLASAVRIESRRAYAAMFGSSGSRTGSGLATQFNPVPTAINTYPMDRAVDAYFANGGQVLHVVRIGTGGDEANGELVLGSTTGGLWDEGGPTQVALAGTTIGLRATSVGEWANGTELTVTYRAFGPTGSPQFDLRLAVPGEPVLHATGLTGDELIETINRTGQIVGEFVGDEAGPNPAVTDGPARLQWTQRLDGGTEPTIGLPEYEAGAIAQAQVDEVALVATPGLAEYLTLADQDHALRALADQAVQTQDRMVITTIRGTSIPEIEAWQARLQLTLSDNSYRRAVAAYGPWLRSENLIPAGLDPYPATDPAGHVCGAISLLDRTRGSGWSPTNHLVADTIDTEAQMTEAEQVHAFGAQLNIVRCHVRGGLELWGSRTLDHGRGRHIAHRRLLHRIVRACRRVAEPLVFDLNNEVLWFTVSRAVSGVLLEAFRSGFLQGDTPDQAYRVRCDERTTTPDDIDNGRVVCEIDLAPAVPMEFITLRLSLGAEGLLEVVEQ